MSTTKPDKYDRYLADVFVGQTGSTELGAESSTPAADSNSSLVTSHSSLFLNNALLEAGHAVRYDGGTKEE